jgi:hypothetical protein
VRALRAHRDEPVQPPQVGRLSDVSWVTQAGAVELAFGAISGFVIALSVDNPDALRRRGVKAIPRLGQAHLDFIIMGVILIAFGLAAPDLPKPWQVLLVVGAWVNPTLFVPLAFNPEAQHRRGYRAVTLTSFVCMSSRNRRRRGDGSHLVHGRTRSVLQDSHRRVGRHRASGRDRRGRRRPARQRP